MSAAGEPEDLLGERGGRFVMSVPEVATLLGISRDLVYDLLARGELPSLRLGRRVVVPTRPLLDLLGAGRPQAEGEVVPSSTPRLHRAV